MKPLNKFEAADGTLVPVNLLTLPFIPKRLFYIYNVPQGQERGTHAHYNTQQVLICVQGVIEVIAFDGINTVSKFLKSGDSFFLDKLIWDSQIFHTGNDVLLSICSTEYDINDYILNKDEFIRIKNANR